MDWKDESSFEPKASGFSQHAKLDDLIARNLVSLRVDYSAEGADRLVTHVACKERIAPLNGRFLKVEVPANG